MQGYSRRLAADGAGNRLRSAVWLLLLSAMLLSGCAAGNSEGRSDGSPSGSPQQATTAAEDRGPRIVATTVAIAEILDALEVELVGVPTSSKPLPARYDGLTEVGNPMSPDMEMVRMLKPDEVLSVTTLEYDLAPKFESAGVQAEFLDFTSLDSMNAAIINLGERYGRQEQAERLVQQHLQKLEELQSAAAGKPAPSVLILMGIPGSYLVATEHSYIGDLVRRLGGTNVVQGEQVEYVASNTEHLQQANPDVILRAAHGLPDEVVKMFDAEFKKNDIWKHFSAVKTGRVYDLEETLFGTTGNLAVGEALEELMELLYE
ncbi:heme ABC transporter substrate-binding protein IsdE [Cohnella cellulosilytica]|uniref:High-affinity heme uptake system protein IsdE n=1 Tax=Cohnella cellulosilytica TaxID=986710 RepID=A0ABW2FN81_9BACL